MCLVSLPVAAEGERKNVLIVNAGGDEVDEFTLKTQVDAALRFGINKIERVRVLDAKEPFLPICDDACIQSLAQKHAADLIVVPLVAAGILNVTVFDAAGAVVVAGDRPYDPDATTEAGVGALVTQLMNPPGYAGTVSLVGVPPRASVFIDGVPLETTRIADGIRLRVGPHRVVARSPDGSLLYANVDVELDGAHEVRVLDQTANSGFPTWPAWIATGTAIGLTVLSGVFLGDAYLNSYVVPSESNRTVTVYEFEVQRGAPNRLAIELERRDITRGLAARDQSVVSGAAFLTVGVAAAVAAVFLWNAASAE